MFVKKRHVQMGDNRLKGISVDISQCVYYIVQMLDNINVSWNATKVRMSTIKIGRH